MKKKYELVKPKKKHYDKRAEYRIRALIDIPERGVKVGDLGGWVEDEGNLSHQGTCWIYNNAMVVEWGGVQEDATVHQSAMVDGYAKIMGNATIGGGAIARGNSQLKGECLVEDCVVIDGNVVIDGHTRVQDRAHVRGDAILDDSTAEHHLCINGDMRIVTGRHSTRPLYICGSDLPITVNTWDCVIVGNTPVSMDNWERELVKVFQEREPLVFDIVAKYAEYRQYFLLIESLLKKQ
jgi:carbonic anhydrase/acetyltransferase-like protein (isoleucine patch superfamily)